jgi:hypothetical protein
MTERAKRRSVSSKKSDTDICLSLPEAPVYRPSLEEFRDPLAYIEGIRATAEPYGVCRIVPPTGWTPPDALSSLVDMRFHARVQNLAALDAELRCRASFTDLCKKYLSLVGIVYSDERGSIDGCLVDLCLLHRAVTRAGGLDVLGHDAVAWFKLAAQVWPDDAPGVARSRATPASDRRATTVRAQERIGLELMRIYTDYVKPWTDFKSTQTPANALAAAAVSFGRSMGSSVAKAPKNLASVNSMTSSSVPTSDAAALNAADGQNGHYHNGNYHHDDSADHSVALVKCEICHLGDTDDSMLLCDDCDFGFHARCMRPPVLKVPETEWYCDACRYKGRFSEFAFVENNKLYSMESFREQAKRFGAAHFGPLPITHEAVEREFWRILSWENENDSIDFHRRSFEIEYGADLHTTVHGSGFAREASALDRCGWNLNNIALVNDSLLRFCENDIDGVIRPWIYVGMMFSAFCWHNEDHYLYSINYLHTGEPKQWFGIAGHNAPQFEAVMKELAPELFDDQPDVLLQLVSILSPARLVRHGVPVTRLTQRAGDFVVTFPAAYHTGFNLGFNCAEAVNFAPADWIPYGALCRSMYTRLRRAPVFSFQRLLCNVARSPSLTLRTALWLKPVLDNEVNAELAARKAARAEGLRFVQRNNVGELLCHRCADLLHFSAVVCARCSPATRGRTAVGGSDAAAVTPENGGEMLATCLAHRAQMCACEPDSNHGVLYCEEDDALRKMCADVTAVYNVPYDWLSRVEPFCKPLPPPNNASVWNNLTELISDGKQLLVRLDARRVRPAAEIDPPNELLRRNRIEPSTVPPLAPARDVVLALRDRIASAHLAVVAVNHNFGRFRTLLMSVCSGQAQISLKSSVEMLRTIDTTPSAFDANMVAPFRASVEIASTMNRRIRNLCEQLGLAARSGVPHDDTSDIVDAANAMLADVRGALVLPDGIDALKVALERAQWSLRGGAPSNNGHTLVQAVPEPRVAAALPLATRMGTIGPRERTDLVRHAVLNGPPYPAGVDQFYVEAQEGGLDQYQLSLNAELLRVDDWCAAAEHALAIQSLTLDDVVAWLARLEPKLFRQHARAERAVAMLNALHVSLSWQRAARALFLSSRVPNDLVAALTKPHVQLRATCTTAAKCVCRKPASGVMLTCSACDEQYHAGCCGLTAAPNRWPARWVCSWCHATRRPPLAEVMALCEHGHKLGLQSPLLAALQALVARATNWQQRAITTMQAANKRVDVCKALLFETDLLEVSLDAVPQLAAFVAHTESTSAETHAASLVAKLEHGASIAANEFDVLWTTVGEARLAHFHNGGLNVLKRYVARIRGIVLREGASAVRVVDRSRATATYLPLARSQPQATVVCACRRSYSGGSGVVLCQLCEEMYHIACVGVSESDEMALAFFACPECRCVLGGGSPPPTYTLPRAGSISVAVTNGKRQRVEPSSEVVLLNDDHD